MQAVPRIMGSMDLATQGVSAMNPRQIKAVEIASRFKIQEKEGEVGRSFPEQKRHLRRRDQRDSPLHLP